MRYILIGLLVFMLMKLLARLWNERNLNLREYHRRMAEQHLNLGRKDEAMKHIKAAQKLQKQFIRCI